MKLHKIFSVILMSGIAAAVWADGPVQVKVDMGAACGEIKSGLTGVSQGGNAGSYMKDGVVAAMKPLPVGMVRLEMVTGTNIYNIFNPDTGKWDWTRLDREIENIKNSGAEVVINLFGTPSWMVSDPKAKVPAFTPPRDYKAYAEFCAAIVKHVNKEKNYGIKYWEIWNEPSGNFFWTAWKPNKETLFALYDVTAKRIKTEDPAILVGGIGDNSQYSEHYRDFFQYALKHKTPVDFLTLHWYGEWNKEGIVNPKLAAVYAATVDKLYRQAFGHGAPIFYSEWNLIAESKDRYPAVQTAAYMGTALAGMQESPLIQGAMFFRVVPYRDPASSLLDRENKHRVAWRVLKMFSMLPSRQVKSVSTAADISVVAGGDRQAGAAMLSRYKVEAGSAPVSVALEWSGMMPGKYQVKIYQENAKSAAQVMELEPVETKEIDAEAGKLRVVLTLDPMAVMLVTAEAAR